MMGLKTAQPKLYYSFSLEAAVPDDHILRRLAGVVDFSFARALTRKFYSHTGQPSIDPVVLFKLSLLGYLFNITSERRLCQQAALDLSWRWFLGYELDEPVPDHSVLSKARRRFGPAVYERFFCRIVQLCEARGLVQGDVLFIDSTLSKANASLQSMRSRTLLTQKLPSPGQFVSELWAVNDVDEDPAPRSKDPRGRPQNPERKNASKSVTNQLGQSATDPDAEVFRKAGQPAMLCHKTHLLVDGGRANIVTAVGVRPACEADSQAVGQMIDKHVLALGRSARELVGDRGYGSEAAMKACWARGVHPTLALRSWTNSSGGLSRKHFTYVPDRDLFICPTGHELRHFTDEFQDRQAIYRPAKGTCHDCPLKPQCAPGRSDRAVTRRWDTELWEEAEARLHSSHGRRLLRRCHILSERMNADAKDKLGLARAQFRGRQKMQVQALMTATVINLKQLLRRWPARQTGSAALPASDGSTRMPHHLALALAVRDVGARHTLVPIVR